MYQGKWSGPGPEAITWDNFGEVLTRELLKMQQGVHLGLDPWDRPDPWLEAEEREAAERASKRARPSGDETERAGEGERGGEASCARDGAGDPTDDLGATSATNLNLDRSAHMNLDANLDISAPTHLSAPPDVCSSTQSESAAALAGAPRDGAPRDGASLAEAPLAEAPLAEAPLARARHSQDTSMQLLLLDPSVIEELGSLRA